VLQGLDRVDWTKRQHAYAWAADVPGLLRAVTGPDPEAANPTGDAAGRAPN
jgi:hypothetical protein